MPTQAPTVIANRQIAGQPNSQKSNSVAGTSASMTSPMVRPTLLAAWA